MKTEAIKKSRIRWILWLIICAVIVYMAASENTNRNKSINTNSDNIEKKIENTNNDDTLITYDNFNNIKMGYSYDKVIEILGEGDEISSSEVNNIKSSVYSWKGEGIDNIKVTFKNDMVTAKSQLNLLKNDDEITKEKYEKVKNNMTYEEVKNIIGEGQILSESKIGDLYSVMYGYMNNDGSNANFTFNNGVLNLKTQFNLK